MDRAASNAFNLKIKDIIQYITDVINKKYYTEEEIIAVIKAIEIILNKYNDQFRKVIFITNMGDFQKFEESQDRKALDYLTDRILLDLKYFLSDSTYEENFNKSFDEYENLCMGIFEQFRAVMKKKLEEYGEKYRIYKDGGDPDDKDTNKDGDYYHKIAFDVLDVEEDIMVMLAGII
jgi:hypothetical protein